MPVLPTPTFTSEGHHVKWLGRSPPGPRKSCWRKAVTHRQGRQGPRLARPQQHGPAMQPFPGPSPTGERTHQSSRPACPGCWGSAGCPLPNVGACRLKHESEMRQASEGAGRLLSRAVAVGRQVGQPAGEVCQCLSKLNAHAPNGPAMGLLGIFPRERARTFMRVRKCRALETIRMSFTQWVSGYKGVA